MSWYRTGTVAINNGSTSVTGTGSAWTANAQPGCGFVGPDSVLYEVAEVTSDTTLTLATNYAGQTVTGGLYAVVPTQGYIVSLAAQAANLLNTFGALRDAYLAGTLQTGIQGVLASTANLPTAPQDGDCYMIGPLLYIWNQASSAWQSVSLQGPQGIMGDVNPANLTAAANAQASQTAAANSATTASNEAAIATTAATTATGAATTATTQAGLASGSASSAATAYASLAAALAAFRSVFVGEFATDPAVDGNGNALTAGAEYFNTTEKKLRVYSGTAWGDYDATAQVATNNAALSASAAAGSASTAGTAATTATGAASTATGAASAAASSQQTASAAATTATNAASAASTSEQNAANSAAAAAQSADEASAGQVNSDWNATSGKAQILNRPNLANVATSGAYGDLSGTPALARVATSGAYGDLSGAPSLARVATSGSYGDLTGTPTAYALPKASNTVLGGIKVGTNLSIDVNGVLSAYGITYVSYANRANLRTTDGPAQATLIVESLGVFVWNAGSNEIDDDETAFASPSGVWTLEVASSDVMFAMLVAEFNGLFLTGSFQMSALSIAAGAVLPFTVNVPGAVVGDLVQAVPGNAFTASGYADFYAAVTAPGVVTVTLTNAGSSTGTLVPSTWSVQIIKQP